jgi:hypothetical protein
MTSGGFGTSGIGGCSIMMDKRAAITLPDNGTNLNGIL